MKLYINTFGNFDILYGDQSLLKDKSRQYRLYKLFQYFITYRNKKILPEVIIDNLFPDNESADPKNVLRTQIFRLRQEIKSLISKDKDESNCICINFINGYYYLEAGEDVVLDSEEFETLINRGDNLSNTNIEEAIELYRKALNLYKGLYLSENPYEVWIVPTRNYYSRLYLKTLFKVIEILKDKDKNEDIIELCDRALEVDPYEEVIHIYLMEAMLKLGHITNTVSHYEYAAKMLEKEVGIKSSPGLKKIQRRIQDYYNQKSEIDLINLSNKLEDKQEDGALQCGVEDFKLLYNIQKRKSTRNNEFDYISIITLDEDKKKYEANEIKKWIKIMSDVLKQSLRVGDVFTFWNDNQILLMLHDVKDDGLEKIENRIRKNLRTYSTYSIKIRYQSLITKDSVI